MIFVSSHFQLSVPQPVRTIGMLEEEEEEEDVEE